MEKIAALCRPARQSDTADMLEITQNIWDGHDYVPLVWGEWLEDQAGVLMVAEYEGRVIGLGKLSSISAEDWWMQGLRVHPEYQGRGVASQLHESLVQSWRQIGRGAVRLATASFRQPVHHLCERLGFHKTGEYSVFAAPAFTEETSPAPDFQPLAGDEVEQALLFASQSPMLEVANGLMDLCWEWAPLRPQYLLKAIQRGQAWWWRHRMGLLAVYTDQEEDEPPRLFVSLLACEPEKTPELLLDYRKLAAALGFQHAAWNVPLHPERLAVLEATGFVRQWEDALYLYTLTA
jgi:GNAT superfamily N-acetyltransferase